MKLSRQHLTVLLNALHETGTTTVPVSHPSDEIGKLLQFDLQDATESPINIELNREEYGDARREVERNHGSPAVDEIPSAASYTHAFMAGGLLKPSNNDDIATFLDRNGNADLTAGHQPVVAGFDTNLLPWRIADVLGLTPVEESPVNGYIVATGVRDELDWDYKRSDTKSLERAFGPEFEEFWNQPAGTNREGRLGELNYRRLRDHRYADEVTSDSGDENIISSIDEYQDENRKTVLLFSNDRDFIERARAHRIRAHRVEFPREIPDTFQGSWVNIRDTLYMLTMLFGVLSLPKVTLHGIWRGKGGQDWHDERIKCDCRSPKIETLLDRDSAILTRSQDIL